MSGATAISFDCWNTLLYEPDPDRTYARRVELVAAAARAAGIDVDLGRARSALDRAWERHWKLWHAEVVSGASEMATWALEDLSGGGDVGAQVEWLGPALSAALLDSDVRLLADADVVLQRLVDSGVRLALICDTGFTGAGTVRQVLAQRGLLELLEVTVFSDEVGVPKPHPRIFERALVGLGLVDRAAEAIHVGDLKRTDIAGARRAGMRTIRIRDRHDDRGEHPEADDVVDRHRTLLDLLDPA